MVESFRLDPPALVPTATGLLWLLAATELGPLGFLVSLAPGALLLATGLSTLLYAGDLRSPHFMALGAALGSGAALLLAPWLGLASGAALCGLSALSFLCAGKVAMRLEEPTPGVPPPTGSWRLAGEVAFDEVVLASMALRTPRASEALHRRVLDEIADARALYAERGWRDDPRAFHRRPTPPVAVEMPRATVGTLSYEHLQFDSEYEPWPEEPGRARWLARAENRRTHVWILRHGAPRPWLVCLHGYEMGLPRMEFEAFRARRLHDVLGLNVAFPTLPLHGHRRTGRRSGAGYLGPDVLDSVHAEAQAMWDVRRLLEWIRARTDEPIGVYGLSLGGYNAALLAALEPLDAVIAGIPAVDFLRLTHRHAAPMETRAAQARGLDPAHVRELLRVVSPLAIEPLVPHGRRAIFAGTADRIVPPDHARDLWAHWDEPRIVWYPGGHVSFRRHAIVERLIDDTLRVAGMLPARRSLASIGDR